MYIFEIVNIQITKMARFYSSHFCSTDIEHKVTDFEKALTKQRFYSRILSIKGKTQKGDAKMKIVEVFEEEVVSELHIDDDVWNNMTDDERIETLNNAQHDNTSAYPVPDNGGEFEIGEGYNGYEVSEGRCSFCKNNAVYGLYPDVDYVAQEVLLCQHHWFINVC